MNKKKLFWLYREEGLAARPQAGYEDKVADGIARWSEPAVEPRVGYAALRVVADSLFWGRRFRIL